MFGSIKADIVSLHHHIHFINIIKRHNACTHFILAAAVSVDSASLVGLRISRRCTVHYRCLLCSIFELCACALLLSSGRTSLSFAHGVLNALPPSTGIVQHWD